MPDIQAVLMDLDGTLADTAHDIVPALNALCREQDRPSVAFEQARNHISQGARALIRLVFETEPDSDEEERLTARLLEIYSAAPCKDTRLFDGMPELLEYFRKRGLPWGVVTNKSESLARPILEALEFPHAPGCLIGRDTLARCKPHPEPLHEAARRLGVPAARCVYLGDDPRDMQAARAAGMTGIVAAFGYILPGTDVSAWDGDGAIRNPLELRTWLEASA